MMNIIKTGIVCIMAATLFSCGSESEKAASDDRTRFISRIDSLERSMVDSATMQLNAELAAQGVNAYQDFINAYPTDSLTPHYLFRLSDLLAHGTGDFARSIECLKMIVKNYPDFKRYPDCIFLQGYYYQEFFRDSVSAKEYYKEFLSKFPEHPFADDAQAMLSMFGKTDAQILEMFEGKSKK